ncbi:unnamed protein product [Litomosoides sigmodontis]|uniref:Uncharacterized protein n=1 Tax=Litomosoides sigmodontis TaxID=42156 RepID=A0A3P6TB56_LITSI|nr:unnamed protein product [Litomosoides sigmodontis]
MLALLLYYYICTFRIASDGREIVIMPDRDDQGTNRGKKGDSVKASTSAEQTTLGPTQKWKSVNLSAIVPAAVGNQDSRNSSTNVKQIPRLFPKKNYELIQKVEEKVIQEKSIRTGSPRHRKATLLHFAPTSHLPDIARVQLLLSNISERPLQFKLKSEPGVDISVLFICTENEMKIHTDLNTDRWSMFYPEIRYALPSAKGHIDAHGSAKCTLTWRREANVNKWSDAQQPKMLLVLDFLHDKIKNEKHTLTRLIGKVVPDQTCDSDRPPVEQLMLDAATNDYCRSMSKESLVPEQAHSTTKKSARDESKVEGVVNNVANWFSQQSKESLLGLFLLMIFFYFLGTLNSSKRRQRDE